MWFEQINYEKNIFEQKHLWENIYLWDNQENFTIYIWY